MSLLKSEPLEAVETMDELLAIAQAMEQEAIAAYSELAERMRRENRPELGEVFDRLVAEEARHLGNVAHWSQTLHGKLPDAARIQVSSTATFDDEGARSVAPELMTAYRAFSMAVRNEERAFVFWTYVASRAPADELRVAAEQMAREELGHVATLRRERRRAFHSQRTAKLDDNTTHSLARLERLLARHLRESAGSASADEAEKMESLAREADDRAESIARLPLGDSPLLETATAGITGKTAALCELLLDCYLDLGERLEGEDARNRSQEFAAGAVQCLTFLHQVAPPEPPAT